MHKHAKVRMLSKSVTAKCSKILTMCRFTWSKITSPCNVALPKSVELSKKRGIDPKMHKVVKVPSVPNMAIWLVKVTWHPEPQSNGPLQQVKVHICLLNSADGKLKHEMKVELSIGEIKVSGVNFPLLAIQKCSVHLIKARSRHSKPNQKVRKFLRNILDAKVAVQKWQSLNTWRPNKSLHGRPAKLICHIWQKSCFGSYTSSAAMLQKFDL